MARTHAILVTHTPERLRRTILGVAWSSARPDTLTLACDSDDPAIEAAARDACAVGDIAMTLTMRANVGKGRSGQTRNNAVRAIAAAGADDADALVFFDGDCVPDHAAIELHTNALLRGQLVLGWRYELSPEQDASFDDDALRAGRLPFTPDPEQTRAIESRHKRYQRQATWKRFGLGKPHKPKLLSANFSCTLGTYRAINGFDETYEGWGQEDDDFGRRVYQSGGRAVVALRDILAYHQYHVTRAPNAWGTGPNAARLSAPCDTVCAHGLKDPLDQPEPRTIQLAP
ncbi:MAG: hypothetical protein DHS20C14_06020 [Phycisphaeraceae bacterium]|nr:MAG: hypothetical protein DHS20C14_06020 [Phycisphaeraceae bacterium]